MWRKKKNVVGARFTNQSSPDNRTNPLHEPLTLRFDDCRSEDRNQSVAQATGLRRQIWIVGKELCLRAAADMQCRNAAAQIFKSHVCETRSSHH